MAMAPRTNYRVSATAAALIRELARKHSLTLVSEWPIEQLQMHCVLFRIPPGTTREAVIEKLLQDKRVLIAQPLNEFESATAATPPLADPYARLQSNFSALDVAEAHNISRGAGVRVAIIDTGVDTQHPDLAGRTQLTRNYIDDDVTEFRNDRHGTQIAGLIAAAANNGIGTIGVAPEVKLLAFKACWQPSPSVRRALQLLHAGAGAGRCAARPGHRSSTSAWWVRAIRCSKRWSRKAIDGGIIVVGAVSEDPRFGFPAKLPRVLAVAEAETSQDAATACCAHRRATSSRWCPMATTISPPAARWPRRRSPAWSRCCWRRIRSSVSTGCGSCWRNPPNGMTPRVGRSSR